MKDPENIDELLDKHNKKLKSEYYKKYRAKNRLKISEKQKLYYEKNKKKIALRQREYYLANIEKTAERSKNYRRENREKVLTKSREYYQKNKEKKKEYAKINKDKISANRKKNRKKSTEREKKRQKYLYHNDPYFKITRDLRSRMTHLIDMEHMKKLTPSLTKFSRDIIGIEAEELIRYLESMFYPHPVSGKKMTWKNHGIHGWHIDHIKPISKFDLTKLSEQQKCFHYKNLQPLWAEENLSKGPKF